MVSWLRYSLFLVALSAARPDSAADRAVRAATEGLRRSGTGRTTDDQSGQLRGLQLSPDDRVWDAVAAVSERYRGRNSVILANFVGAALVTAQIIAVGFPWEGGGHFGRDVVIFGSAGAVYLIAATVTVDYLGRRRANQILTWVRERREPTTHEQSSTLFLPVAVAGEIFGRWLFGALLAATVEGALGYPLLYALRVGLVIVLAGLTSAALSFLLLERSGRPVLQLIFACEDQPVVMFGLRWRLMLAWVLSGAVPIVLLGTAPIGLTASQRAGLPVSLMVIAAAGVVAGLAVTFALTRSLVESVNDLQIAQRMVRQGDLTVRVPVDDIGEVGLLKAGFNDMVYGLRERQQLYDLFGRHVGTEVARVALAGSARLGGRRCQASVLFVDVIGSTTLAQCLPPESLVALLNEVFAAVVRCIGKEDGWVNKFEGDAALCVFGPPAENIGHSTAVLRAARALRVELMALARRYPGLDVAIGVSSGVVVAGNIGAEDRYEYTVIGDPVNEAARLTEQAKTVPERVLAAHGTIVDAADEAQWWQPYEVMKLRGRSDPTNTFIPVLCAASSFRVYSDTPRAK
ncbi:adenylate/guanylate cyclase domain-containing protein [Nocardia arthritidis]|uniref:adenylate/guanylate cyclase domain-containing protein n=1 Tax=Nocardia arthritidis TaxID=228602 RepID=UPI001EEC274C|nr:adenylate/guanylate cyclase domain-containing protein [Nocardia arthritidis]